MPSLKKIISVICVASMLATTAAVPVLADEDIEAVDEAAVVDTVAEAEEEAPAEEDSSSVTDLGVNTAPDAPKPSPVSDLNHKMTKSERKAMRRQERDKNNSNKQ